MLRVLAIFLNHIASTEINVVHPLRTLADAGEITFDVALEELVTPEQVAAADVIVACRNMDPVFRPVFELARSLGIPWIYDLDDNLWEVPHEEAHEAYYHHPARQEMLNWMLKNAQCVRVHSPRLIQMVTPYNPNVHLVRAAVDWSLVPPTLPELPTDHVPIVYATSRRAGDLLFERMKPDLTELLEEYGDRIRLHIMGAEPGELRRFPQVIVHAYSDDYSTWFRQFTRAGYAIGLAPMLTDNFHECKTDTKFRDYAAAGAAGIYQDSAVYRASVTDGVTGLLVSGARGSWSAAIQRLTNDRRFLLAIRENASQVVRTRNSLVQATASWMDDLRAVPARPPTPVFWEPPRWDFTLSPDSWRIRLRPYARQILPIRLRVWLRNLILGWQLRGSSNLR